MLSRKDTFGNSFSQMGGTESTPLSGVSWVIVFAHKSLFSVRNKTGFCYVALRLPRCYILSPLHPFVFTEMAIHPVSSNRKPKHKVASF